MAASNSFPVTPLDALRRILDARVVPIIRTRSPAWAEEVADILAAAGLPVMEVAFTLPQAEQVVAALRRRFPDVLVGAGTVTDEATAERAVAAGAQFLLSPALSPGMVAVARRRGVLAVPGAYTPHEVWTALQAGAELVKIFPAESGGPAHIRALLGPFPQARLLPTGGVRPETVGEWLEAGAVAVGMGSALVGPGDRPVDAPALQARLGALSRTLGAARRA